MPRHTEDERPNAPARQWQTQGAAPVGPAVEQPQLEGGNPNPGTVNQATTVPPAQTAGTPEGSTVPPAQTAATPEGSTVPPAQTAATPEGSTVPPAQTAATPEAAKNDQGGTTTQNAVTPQDPASATTTTISSQMTKEDNATVHEAAQAAEAVNAAKIDNEKQDEEQKNNTVWIVISVCALVVVFLGLLGSCFAISMSPSPSERRAACQAPQQHGDALATPLPFPEPAAPRQSTRLLGIPEGRPSMRPSVAATFVPSAEATARPSLAAATRASVAGTAMPSVQATTRPSMAATTRPSVAATTRPSVTTTTRPSVRGSLRPPPAEETVEVVDVVEETVEAPGTESAAKTPAVLEFREEEVEEEEAEEHTGDAHDTETAAKAEDKPRLQTQFSDVEAVEEVVEVVDQEQPQK